MGYKLITALALAAALLYGLAYYQTYTVLPTLGWTPFGVTVFITSIALWIIAIGLTIAAIIAWMTK